MSYEYNQIFKGDRVVIDDLYQADYAYAESIDEESSERYEIRRTGTVLGRFGDLEDAKDFLDGKEL